MIEKVKRFVVVWLALCVPLTCPQARAQLRSDLIESARMEKEASLTPEKPPKVERKIVWAENSLGYKLLTGQMEGVGVGFGTSCPALALLLDRSTDAPISGEGVSRSKWRPGAAINESYLAAWISRCRICSTIGRS